MEEMPFWEGMGALEHGLGSAGAGPGSAEPSPCSREFLLLPPAPCSALSPGLDVPSASKHGSNGLDNPRAWPRGEEREIPRCSTTAAGERHG